MCSRESSFIQVRICYPCSEDPEGGMPWLVIMLYLFWRGIHTPLSNEMIYFRYSLLQLINGDLSPSFKHRGFRQDLKSTTVLKSVDDESNHTVWLRGVISTLEEVSPCSILSGKDFLSLIHKCCCYHVLFDFLAFKLMFLSFCSSAA